MTRGKAKQEESKVTRKIKCLGSCERELTLSTSNFFKSNNPEFQKYDGFSPVCKSCSRAMIFNSDNTVNIDEFKKVLQYLNKPFIRSVFEELLISGFTLGDYTSRLNFGAYRNMTYANSDDDNKKSIKSENKKNEDIEEDSIEIQMLRDKWGDNLAVEQLLWMDKQYKKWENDYAINNELDDTIVEQIIFEKWYIQKERQEGKPVDKRIETMNKLLKQGNFKKRSSEDSEIDSIAMYIAEWEKGRPFLKQSNTPEFQDPDNFIKLAEVLAGATARTIGRSNNFTDKFDEYYKNVTLDLGNLEGTDEEGEKNDKSKS
jgi:hypothetical protein